MGINKIPCHYAILRFAPFVETGEFANVGVVLLAPRHGFFDFKLITNRHARVTHFFPELDAGVLRNALRVLTEELSRIQDLVQSHRGDAELITRLFHEVVRPRETIVRYSEPRGALAEDPARMLEDVFGYYVERTFVTKEYQEVVLEKGVRNWLTEASLIERFTKAEVGDRLYHATFPFVEKREGQPVKLIKPLNLAQDQPSKVIDHGIHWASRLNELKKRKVLPERVLFALAGPDGVLDDGAPQQEAFQEVETMLADAGATVLPFAEKEGIIDFARAA